MGIKGLTALLAEHAPSAIKDHDIKTLFGRKVAIDASMSIYQFLIAVRSRDGEVLTNEAGETTSHLMGLFYRTIRIVENGIKPAYVFDGKPPELKSGVLAKRFERRKEAVEQGEEAKEVGTAEDVERYTRRTVRVTKEHNAECQRLLKLMGIPFVIAPSEAEAQCAELARGAKVYAAGSEDMDTLTFNAPILLRHLTFSEAKKAPITEVNLQKALEGLDMDMDGFIELCILLGCDYLEPIKGVGPKSALKLMREYGSLAKVLKHLREKQAEKEKARASLKEEDPEEEEEEEEYRASSDVERDVPTDDEKAGASGSSPSKKAAPSKPKPRKPTRIADSDESEDEKMAVDRVEPDSDADDADHKPSGKAKSSDVDEDEKEPSSSKSKAKGKSKAAKASKPPAKPKGSGKGGISVPEYYPWDEAKELFKKPDVTPADQLELNWEAPDIEGLVEFLVKEKGFNEDRVRKASEKLTKVMHTKQQGRLDGFFTVKPKEPVAQAKGTKRKGDDKKDAGKGSKKAKAGKK